MGLSILPSECFSWIGSLVFFWNSALMNPYDPVCDRLVFFESNIFLSYRKKWVKNNVLNLLVNFLINFFLNLVFNESLCYLLYSFTNPILGKICFQNLIFESDCRIFKSTISLGQNDATAWFFVWWYKFIKIKKWLKNIGVDLVKNGQIF